MGDLYQKFTDSRGLLEKIASKIPGFGGYMEKETRREADRMLRDLIANRYGEQLSRVQSLQTQLVTGTGIEYVDDLQNAATRLQRFVDSVKTAAYGYAGLFSAVQVKEEQLAKLYAFDNALLDNADKIVEAVNTVETSMGGDDLGAAIRNLTTLVTQCNDAFERRKEVLIS